MTSILRFAFALCCIVLEFLTPYLLSYPGSPVGRTLRERKVMCSTPTHSSSLKTVALGVNMYAMCGRGKGGKKLSGQTCPDFQSQTEHKQDSCNAETRKLICDS